MIKTTKDELHELAGKAASLSLILSGYDEPVQITVAERREAVIALRRIARILNSTEPAEAEDA